jgi:nucleotide-binding universal stress UspA family protein
MKLILATDGSQYAEEAAWLLSRLPHSEKLELIVLFINNLPDLRGAQNATALLGQLQIANQNKASSIFNHLKSIFQGANATLELVVGEGQIGTQIVDIAESRKCDLVVLGAVGHSLIERMFGSTSDFVATHAGCSVLVVRPTGLRAASRPINVCIAYDEERAFATTSVVSMPFNYSDIHIPFEMEEIIELRKGRLQVAADRIRELSSNVTTHVLEENHIGNAIVRFAKKSQSDIVVLGDSGGGFVSTLFLGSVSKYVLRHAECSVWIARTR